MPCSNLSFERLHLPLTFNEYQLATACQFLHIFIVARQHRNHDFAFGTQCSNPRAQDRITVRRREDAGARLERRCELCQLAQIQTETGGRAGTAESLSHFVIATAEGDGLCLTGAIGGKAHTAVIVVTAQIREIETGHRGVNLRGDALQRIERGAHFRQIRQHAAGARQHIRSAVQPGQRQEGIAHLGRLIRQQLTQRRQILGLQRDEQLLLTVLATQRGRLQARSKCAENADMAEVDARWLHASRLERAQQELHHFEVRLNATVGHERGTVTGRVRRCGWFDAAALRRSIQINGVTGLCLTKLDVLDGIDELQICTGYRVNGEVSDLLPLGSERVGACEPIYETMPGWSETTVGAKRVDDLPAKARAYIARIEALCEVPVDMISTGPDREETIVLRHPFA